MSDAITPALTREDWADAREMGNLQMFVMNTEGIPPRLLPAQHGHRPAAMLALANHVLPDGHPLKITREDVSNLDLASYLLDGDGRDGEMVAAVAAKLAGLLPPE